MCPSRSPGAVLGSLCSTILFLLSRGLVFVFSVSEITCVPGQFCSSPVSLPKVGRYSGQVRTWKSSLCTWYFFFFLMVLCNNELGDRK